MSRLSGLVRAAARALLTAAFAIALGTSVGALAQDSSPAANDATAAELATPAEQPRRNRDRRRNADAAVEAAAPVTAATAATATEAVAATAQQAETVEARMVCKNIKLTGTKISKRICGTPEQWAATNEKTSDDASETMRQVRQQTGIVVTQPGTPGPGGFGAGN
jgi:hypothetical protein